MIKLFIPIIVISTCPLANSDDFSFSRPDHQKHVSLMAAGSFIAAKVFNDLGASRGESIFGAIVVGAIVGTAKELNDSYFSKSDMAANGIGLAIGTIGCAITWEF